MGYRLQQKLKKAKEKIRRGSVSSLSMVDEHRKLSDDDKEVKECEFVVEEGDDDGTMNESDYFPSDYQSDNDHRRRANIKYNLRNLKKEKKCEKVRRSKRLQKQKKEDDGGEDGIVNAKIKKVKKNRKRSFNEVNDTDEIDYFGNQRKRLKLNRMHRPNYSSLGVL